MTDNLFNNLMFSYTNALNNIWEKYDIERLALIDKYLDIILDKIKPLLVPNFVRMEQFLSYKDKVKLLIKFGEKDIKNQNFDVYGFNFLYSKLLPNIKDSNFKLLNKVSRKNSKIEIINIKTQLESEAILSSAEKNKDFDINKLLMVVTQNIDFFNLSIIQDPSNNQTTKEYYKSRYMENKYAIHTKIKEIIEASLIEFKKDLETLKSQYITLSRNCDNKLVAILNIPNINDMRSKEAMEEYFNKNEEDSQVSKVA